MADDADLAGPLIERSKDNSVTAIRKQLAGSGQDYCDDCGEDLSPARREAAPWAIRCVPCASVYEQKQTHRR